MKKNRYLVPKDIKVYSLICMVRKRMKMNRLYALVLFVNGKEMLKSGIFRKYIFILKQNHFLDGKVGEIYEKYKDRDGFLYLEYQEHLAFG